MMRDRASLLTGFKRLMFGSLATLLLVITAVGVGAQPSAECDDPEQIVVEPDGWAQIKGPVWPDEPRTITSYAVDPQDPQRLYVTNGHSVMRSGDGGCSWEKSYQIPGLPSVNNPFSTTTTSTSTVVVPEAAAAHDRVYVVLHHRKSTSSAPNGRSGVLRSDDAGVTWATQDLGLLPGRPLKLVGAPSEPTHMYLAALVEGVGTVVYKTIDSGGTWMPTASPQAVAESGLPPELTDLGVDPVDAAVLWATSGGNVYHSDDGGATWSAIPTAGTNALGSLDVYHPSGSDARVLAFARDALVTVRSEDGGETWESDDSPAFIESAARGSGPDDLVVSATSADGRTLVFHHYDARWIPIKATTPRLYGLTADRTTEPSFWAYSSDRLWRYRPPPEGPEEDPEFDPDEDLPKPPPPPKPKGCARPAPPDVPAPTVPGPKVLSPSLVTRVMAPGESRTIRYELDLPPDPTAIDIFFLIDASNSMHGALCGAAHGATDIARTLVARGIDAWFGAGTYQDLPDGSTGSLPSPSLEPELCSGPAYAYRLDHPMAALTASLGETLSRLTTCGGVEPQMEALVQSVTGKGQLPWIFAGQDAKFRRDGPLPVIVHISDEPLNRSRFIATTQEAVDALNSEGVKQIGLYRYSARPPDATHPPARTWLGTVATGTATVAIAPGVDCDRDGTIDVQPGAPLVCPIDGGDSRFGVPMAGVIVDSLLSIPDMMTVELVETTASGVVTSIEPPTYEVDRRIHNTPHFDVTYTCSSVGAFDVDLAARDQAVPLLPFDSARALITCVNPPVPNDGPPGIAPPPAVSGPTVPSFNPGFNPQVQPGTDPAPQIQPQPQPQPQPQANAQPQSQSQSQAQGNTQAQVQAGVAAQKQEQVQTAFAQAANSTSTKEQYSMSARRERRNPNRLPVVIGGVLTLAYGCVLRTRTRTRRAEARNR